MLPEGMKHMADVCFVVGGSTAHTFRCMYLENMPTFERFEQVID